jgi:hypothetical protein
MLMARPTGVGRASAQQVRRSLRAHIEVEGRSEWLAAPAGDRMTSTRRSVKRGCWGLSPDHDLRHQRPLLSVDAKWISTNPWAG